MNARTSEPLLPLVSSGLDEATRARIEAVFADVTDTVHGAPLVAGQAIWSSKQPDALVYIVSGSAREVELKPDSEWPRGRDPTVAGVIGAGSFVGLEWLQAALDAVEGPWGGSGGPAERDRVRQALAAPMAAHRVVYVNPGRRASSARMQVRTAPLDELAELLLDPEVLHWFRMLCERSGARWNVDHWFHGVLHHSPILRALGEPAMRTLVQCARVGGADSGLQRGVALQDSAVGGDSVAWRGAGEPCGEVHLVVSGHAESLLPSESGGHVVSLLSPGDLLDAEYAVDGDPTVPRRLDIRVSADATILTWDLALFRALLADQPAAWERLLAYVDPVRVATEGSQAEVTCIAAGPAGWGHDDDPVSFSLATAMALSRYWRHPRCVAFVHVGDAERLSELLGVDAGLWVPAVPDPDAEGTHVGYQVLKLDARDQTLGELELSATSDLKKVWLVRPDHLHDVVALVEVLRARVDIAHVVVFVDHRSRTRVNADTPPIRNNRQAQGDPWFTDSSALVCLDGLRVVPYTTLWLCTDPDGWYTLTDEAPDRLIRVDRLTPAFVRQARRRAQDYLTTDKHLEHDDRPGNRTHGNMMVPMGEGPISGHLKVLIEGRSEPPDWVAEATGRAARIIQRRSVGVALGGGGTWGAAHIAILRALRRADVPVDYVSGTSFGALMGGLYAGGGLPALDLFLERCRFAPSGASRWMPRRVRDAIRRLVPAALEDLRNEARALTNPVAGAQRRGMLGDPSALDDLVVRIVTDTLEPPNPIAHVAADEDLCLREAHVPFFAVASSLTTHQEYAPYHLPLGLAVRAASGLPPGFPGMWFKGAKFIDGAALANVPCGVLKANGADFVIAINVVGAGKVARRTPGRPSVGTLGERITDTVTTGWLTLWKAGTAQAERYADALVDVRIRGVGLASTWRAPEIVEGLTAQLAEREVAEALRQAWHGAEPGDDLLRIALTVPEERG